jgi:hypothetical protein
VPPTGARESVCIPQAHCSKTWESNPLRNPIRGARFRRDVKLAQKRGNEMAKLREVILLLIEGNPLLGTHSDLF